MKKQKKDIKIGVSLFSETIPFHQNLKKGLDEEAKKQNNDLITLSAEYDNDKQAEHVKDLISKKVDVIVICPIDSFVIGESILLANQAGIPVITADTANMSEKGEVISHITSDNIQGGKLAGKLMARAIKYEGNLLLERPTLLRIGFNPLFLIKYNSPISLQHHKLPLFAESRIFFKDCFPSSVSNNLTNFVS